MTRLIDLSRTLENVEKKNYPASLLPLSRIIAPDIEYVGHQSGARIMQDLFQCPSSHLPEGEGWAEENISLSSHLGTHVDAPWHYGSTCAGKKARTIDEIDLSELYCDGVVLDLSHRRGSSSAITVDDLEAALSELSYKIKPGDAVLLRTDHDKFDLLDEARYNYPGMTRQSSLWLAARGVKVGGTDALGWDRPFPAMIEDYKKLGDKSFIWDAHFAFREVEFFIVQQLVNLDRLPPYGFKVAFFPLKIAGASAAPARAVAFVED